MPTPIELSRLDPPDVIETLDYEAILAALKVNFQEYAAIKGAAFDLLDIESDPVVTILEVVAYREMILRARINDAARAVMLASATGSDLEHRAALYGVERLVVSPADPDAVPPIAAVMETDASLRQRTQLAVEGFSTAGPRNAYLFHALSHDGRILDAEISSPTPGEVRVVYYAEDETGPIASLTSSLVAALSADDVRPLTDTVTVAAATPVYYNIVAEIIVGSGPDSTVVEAKARAALQVFLGDRKRVGSDHPISGIYAALHQPGVDEVVLTTPAADVVIGPGEVGLLGTLSLTMSET